MKYLEGINAARGAQPSRSMGFADIVWLHGHSAWHKHLAWEELERRVLPPLRLGQFKLIYKDDRPFAYASWASVTPEVGMRLQGASRWLNLEEWNCGSDVVLMDVVAPFCAEEEVLAKLTKVLRQRQDK